MCVWIYIYIYIHIYVYIYTYAFLYIYMYILMYAYVYTYGSVSLIHDNGKGPNRSPCQKVSRPACPSARLSFRPTVRPSARRSAA